MAARYDQAAASRAKVLAFIRDNPGVVLYDVMRHMDMTKERAAQILLRMDGMGEIKRVKSGMARSGNKCYQHYAVTERTATADEIRAHVAGNLKKPGVGRRIVRFQTARRALPTPMLFGGL